MQILGMYVDGGKGHYVPAKAVLEEFSKKGHATELVEFFDFLDIKWIGKINKWWWRQMLKSPKLENKLSKHNDADSNGMELAIKFAKRKCSKRLQDIMEKKQYDLVFCTHPYASTIISAMFKSLNINIPVYYFATDVFNAPVASISKDIKKFLISTEEGLEKVVRLGQPRESIMLVSFPLQASVANSPKLEKKDARQKIGIAPDLFTIQLNLGGEGLGSIKLIEALMSKELPAQIVVLGGINDSMRSKLAHLNERYKSSKTKLIVAGFVNNVNEYLLASDIIVGRAGINTIVEAMYMHRPFLITELVYTVIPSADYVEKYKVGWNATNDIEKQVSIIEKCISDECLIKSMDANFDSLSIKYGSSDLVDALISDFKEYEKN